MWLSQCSSANSCEVETTDTQTKLCTYGCGTRAVSAIRWILRRMEEQSSGLSANSRRLINDEATSAPVPTAARWRRRIRDQSYAPMDAPKKLSHYQGNGEGSQKGCTDKALALMKGCTEEALALMITGRRQWQRESKRCTDDALALMSGCTDEALALMAARRRQ
nr:hypothetical protein CFP56_77758 [Quercus suber]